MDAMNKFIEQQKDDGAPAAEAVAAEESAPPQAKEDEAAPAVTLLVTGAADTDTVTQSKSTRDSSRDMKVPYIFHLPDRVRVAKIFAGPMASHSIAVDVDGQAYAWGLNTHGQLGVGRDDGLIYAPTPITSVSGRVAEAACGRMHTALATADGGLYTCGRNVEGQLGLGRLSSKGHNTFSRVTLGNGEVSVVKSVACGANFSLCADAAGNVWSCGHPEHGVLGNGSDGKRLERSGKDDFDFESSFGFVAVFLNVEERPGGRRVEEAIADPPKIGSVAAGKEHCIAMEDPARAAGPKPRIFTWGFGGYGRLGHRVQAVEMRPRLVAELDQGRHLPIASISSGATCSFAIDNRGSLYYWGKIPNAMRGEATMYPKMVQELCNWETTSVAAGTEAIFAAAEDKLVTWGSSVAGELSLGVDGPRGQRQPAMNQPFMNWKTQTVAAGYGHALFLATPADGYNAEKAPVFVPPEPKQVSAPAPPGKKGGKRGAKGAKGAKSAKRGRKKK